MKDKIFIDSNIFLYAFNNDDSLILSSAINSKCDILYSEDMQHKLRIESLTIINPFQ